MFNRPLKRLLPALLAALGCAHPVWGETGKYCHYSPLPSTRAHLQGVVIARAARLSVSVPNRRAEEEADDGSFGIWHYDASSNPPTTHIVDFHFSELTGGGVRSKAEQVLARAKLGDKHLLVRPKAPGIRCSGPAIEDTTAIRHAQKLLQHRLVYVPSPVEVEICKNTSNCTYVAN